MANVETESKKLPKIVVNDPAEFNSIADMTITTTREVSKMINSLFKTIFADCLGTTVEVRFVEQKGYIAPKLHFILKDKEFYDNIPEGKFAAFIPSDFNGQAGTLLNKINRVSGMSTGVARKVDMTDEAKSVLEDFMLGNVGSKFDWKGTYQVKTTRDGVVVEVFKLDIVKMIRKYYGDKDKTVTYTDAAGREVNPRFFYAVNPIDALPNNVGPVPDNWKMSITRVSEQHLNEAADLLGWRRYNGDGNIVTDLA